MLDCVFRPFVTLTPEMRNLILGRNPRQADFGVQALARVSVHGGPVMQLMSANAARPIFYGLYTLVREVISADSYGPDGRFFLFNQDRSPRLANGEKPVGRYDMQDLYGTCIPQKGRPIGGQYFARTSPAILWNDLRAYESDISLYGQYTVSVNERSYETIFDPYVSLFSRYLAYMRQVVDRKSKVARATLSLFDNIGTELVNQKGGGLFDMSLRVMKAQTSFDTMPVGPGVFGATIYLPGQGPVRSDFGEISIEPFGALAFLRGGTNPTDAREVNKYHAMDKILLDDKAISWEKSMQFGIYAANDVMSAATNSALFKVLLKPAYNRFDHNGLNEYYLTVYEDVSLIWFVNSSRYTTLQALMPRRWLSG